MPDDVDPAAPIDPMVGRQVAVLGDRMTEVRLQREALERTAAVARGTLQAVEMERSAAIARGATARQLGAIEKRGHAARLRLAAVTDAVREVATLEVQLHKEFEDVVLPLADPLAALAGNVPIALLPVRLETRFQGDSLRVRIYPDTLHVDQHEPLLSAEEESFGRAWWSSRWSVQDDAEAESLWSQALMGRRAGRVAWVLDQTRPTNLADLGTGEPVFAPLDLRATGPSRAPRAQLLPTRWVIIGYRREQEVLREWSGTVADPLALGIGPDAGGIAEPSDAAGRGPVDRPDEQEALAIDDDVRWAVDYDRAVAAGMAVTIPARDVRGGLSAGLDRLVVIGVSHRAGGTAELEAALAAHRFTSGLDFVAVGTPTNADDADAVAPAPTHGPPTVAPPPVAAPGGSAHALARALGLPDDGTLGAVGGAASPVNAHAEHLHTVLWEPTLGYFLRQMMEPVVGDEDIAGIRDHFRRHVRPRGPLPLLRIGRQPYGVLPVTALDRHTGHSQERLLTSALRGVRPLWVLGTPGALQLGSSGKPGEDLVKILERSSRSVRWRMREAFGPGVMANTDGKEALYGLQQVAALMLFKFAGLPGRPRIVDITLAESQAVLPLPLVTRADLSKVEGLTDDYIARIVMTLSRRGGYASLVGQPGESSALLEALLVHSANLEVVAAGTAVAVEHLRIDMPLGRALLDAEIDLADRSRAPGRGQAVLDPRTPGGEPVARQQLYVENEGTAAARLSVTPSQLANQPLIGLTGNSAVADWLIEKADSELERTPATRRLSEFRKSLKQLVGVPTKALHEGTAETLDAVSHRFDAWVTSLATRRLTTLRESRVAGLHIGAFGWVENLRPSADRRSLGYVHAPSVPQATTAAVLRSGHLARGTDHGGPLAVDLSSRRVRTALKLAEGLRSGQSLGALLGYRFERALRDRGVELAQYILPIRQRHPLAPDLDYRDGGGPVEAIAARNVVDGAALAALEPPARAGLVQAAGVATSHRDVVTAEIEALAESVDALGDLLVAESVHQVVLGNSERASAALNALDRQQPVPEVQVAATHRAGTGVNHRLLMLLDDAAPPTEWRGLTDVRSAAEPRVNAWVARALGAPEHYRLATDVLTSDGEVRETVIVGLDELGISPLSVVMAASRGAEEVSELEERLAIAFAQRVTASDAAGLTAHDGPAPGSPPGSAGLGELMLTARGIIDLVSSARGATLRDLAPENDRVDAGIDIAELAARAAKVRSAVEVVAGSGADIAGMPRRTVVRRLHSAGELGIRGALPRSDDLDALRAQLTIAAEQARRLLALVDTAQRSFDERTAMQAATDDLLAEHYTSQIRAVLGEDLPVVPRLAVPPSLRASLSASAFDVAMLDGAPLAPTEFLLAHARVRPAVARLWDVLTRAELAQTGMDAAQLVVAQLPHRTGERWVGRPLGRPGHEPTATTSLLVHRTAAHAQNIPAAVHALVVDLWQETIPHPEQTTGVAFHHDAPGARAPQSILLAVPPDPDSKTWRLDVLVDIVNEAFDLVQMRLVDSDDVPAVGCVLPACYLAFNTEQSVPTFHLPLILSNVVKAWGHPKEFR